MKNYRKRGNGLSSQALQLKKRIARNRTRAIFVGLLYLLGVIALTAAIALVPMFKNGEAYTAMKFYEAFTSMDLSSTAGLLNLAAAALYTVVLLVAVISVIVAFSKLGWLFKKSANNTYGFNRNVYAMTEMAKAFSSTLIVIMLNYFLIALCDKTLEFEMMFAIVLAVGIVFHVLCGVWGAKTRYYDVEGGQVLEQSRLVGRFAPFFRNCVQLVSVIAMMHFLMEVNVATGIVESLLGNGTADMIFSLIFALVIVCLIPLVKHAADITEYNMDGYEGEGMKTFRVFAFFVFLLATGAAVYDNFVVGNELNVQLLIVAGVAFISFVLELLMRRRPRFPDEIEEKVEEEKEPEMGLNAFSQAYGDTASLTETKKDKKAKKGKKEAATAVTTYSFGAQNQANAGGNTVITYPQPQPYPMPYPVPYPQQPQQPMQPQQPLMPYPGMMNTGAGILPVMAGMAMLPTVMNGLGLGQQQPMNMQVQNTNLLPSQAMREALAKNGSARAAAEKILFSDGVKPPKKSRKQRRKEEKARQKALRKMERPVMAEERVSVVDPIVEEKTFVQAPVEEEKVLPAPVMEENEVEADDDIESAFMLDDDDMMPIKIDVECPCCHKKLRITSVAMYNRCPGCKTVFQVRKAQK